MGRPGIQGVVEKLGARLGALGVTPNWITFAGLVVNVAAAVLVAQGRFVIAVVIGVTGSLMDLFDGAVAKARGGGTRRGAFFDAVADRVSEAMYMAGIAWYLVENENPLYAVLCLGVLASGYLISYTRSKASEYGLAAQVGLMERAERTILIGVGVLLQTWWNVLPWFLWAIFALNLITAAQRFFFVWRQGETEPPLPVEEIRIFPEWKDLRTHISASGDEEDDSSIRRAWELQRAEWTERRERAVERRSARKDENRRVKARLRADLRTQRRALTRRESRNKPRKDQRRP